VSATRPVHLPPSRLPSLISCTIHLPSWIPLSNYINSTLYTTFTHSYQPIPTSMVNPIYTEPDPDNDLDPDIRNYSHTQSRSSRDRSPASAQASSPTYTQPSPLESNPLSFVSEKPTVGTTAATVAVAAAASHNAYNEKDYATAGFGTATTIGSQSETAAGTTLNPSPTGPNLDRQTSVSTTRSSVHPDDVDPVFPFISWKQSAIVSHKSYRA
jgi:hypothetical protein